MNLLNFIGAFHVEVSRLLDIVESAGEASGYMEWATGKVGDVEVFFLWFPKTRRLVYAIQGHQRNYGEVEVKGVLEAIAYVERMLKQLRR
ncbi:MULTISPECIES: hypothetical protein [Pyrobaculum]|uniref:Uncharacterized protein n=2 Tax=Pyrobaculum arsenaticum TaxID=121277 RepID=A4WJM2_PYRAR|nr:hypothetical protein [Pyrobaculum arsenaticum]ABP50589.1 conserved hypothetical protein [Pyrobaculum arsenaticum DSM 13514]MCY0890576.1 hypothetical protein [Pyrobaculum arsenaticum]NYR14482.1 hypothetical protein [Pyrobaculum arsenaticum]